MVVLLILAGCQGLFGEPKHYEIVLDWVDHSQNLDLHVMPNPDLAFTTSDYSPCNTTGSRSYWLELTDGSEAEYVKYIYGDSKELWIGVHHNGGADPVAWTDVDLTMSEVVPRTAPTGDLDPGGVWLFDIRVGFDDYDWQRTDDWGIRTDCGGLGDTGDSGDSG